MVGNFTMEAKNTNVIPYKSSYKSHKIEFGIDQIRATCLKSLKLQLHLFEKRYKR